MMIYSKEELKYFHELAKLPESVEILNCFKTETIDYLIIDYFKVKDEKSTYEMRLDDIGRVRWMIDVPEWAPSRSYRTTKDEFLK